MADVMDDAPQREHTVEVRREGVWYVGVCSCGVTTQTPRHRSTVESWARMHVLHWQGVWARHDGAPRSTDG